VEYFDNKVVMITGANSGIGKTAVIMFAKKGAKVVLVARRQDLGLQTLKEITDLGGEAFFIQADVSLEIDVEGVVSEIINKYGCLDIAFNNAGVVESPVGVSELTESEWDRVLGTNLKGTWLCMKHQIKAMDGRGGAIVNMASIYGLVGTGMGLPAYIASKHGVVGLTKAAALECAQKEIRINAICPGWVPTPGNEATLSQPDINALAHSLHPIGRLGTQSEVVETVMWLCSDQSSFMTGQAIAIDGGYTSQ